MDGYSIDAEIELRGNLLIRLAIGDQSQDFELAWSKRRVVLALQGGGDDQLGAKTISPSMIRRIAATNSRSKALLRM